MVFTRSKQAAEDAAEITKINAACDPSAHTTPSTASFSTDNVTLTLTSGGNHASASLTVSNVKIVVNSAESKEEATTAHAVSRSGATKRKQKKTAMAPNKRVKVEDEDDVDYNPQKKVVFTNEPKHPRRARSGTASKGTQSINIKKEAEDSDDNFVPETKAVSTTGLASKLPVMKQEPDNDDQAAVQATASLDEKPLLSDNDSDYCPEHTIELSARGFVNHKRILRRRRPVVMRSSAVTTLRIRSFALGNLVKRLTRKHLRAVRKAIPSTNKTRFTFSVDKIPFHRKPTKVDVDTVARILEDERDEVVAQLIATSTATPAHSGKEMNFDAITRVIVSQACTNEAALDAQQSMILAYPYDVKGVKVVGTKPNYHLMRYQSVEKLQQVLRRAGLHGIKAKPIKEALDTVYAINVSRLAPGEMVYRGNEPNARDFVPGLLSLTYLNDVYRVGGKQAVFDHLVSFSQIGVKTASCLMAFHMDLPVFAVDTHVAKMAKLLAWAPEDASEEDVCSHLDSRMIDDDQKLTLHQDFWRHRRACAKCSGRSPNSWAYQNTVCPLEHLITRPSQPTDPRQSPPKVQTKAPRKATKKEPDAADMKQKGFVKVTYQVDDDFDAAASGEATMRSVWIQDFSALGDPVEVIDDYGEIEEIEVMSETIRRHLEARENAATK